jgi:uncharacterized membrane protein
MTTAVRRYSDLPLAHWVALACFLGLILVLTVTTFWPSPVEGASALVILSVKILPLLLFIPGLLRARNTTYIWACFMLMIYFIPFSASAYINDWPTTTVILLALTIAFFTAAMFKLKHDPGNPGMNQTAEHP